MEDAKQAIKRFFMLLLVLLLDFASFLAVLLFLHFGEWAINNFVHSPKQQETFQLVHYVMSLSTWVVIFTAMIGRIIYAGMKEVRDADKH